MGPTASTDASGKALPFDQQNHEWRVAHTLYTVRGWCSILHGCVFAELPSRTQDKMVTQFARSLAPEELTDLMSRLLT